MRTLIIAVVMLWLATSGAACSGNPRTPPTDAPVVENCNTVGDEDGNGLADCNDPACAGLPICQPVCGNGIVESGEQCDDGNMTNGDACETNCRLPACGNGIVDIGEACDDGNTRNGDACEANCTLPACGNSIVDIGEACDDGNTRNGDACEANCTLPACGNGIVDAGEQCDDGNAVDGDACEANCRLPACGNGIVDIGEACDDGNTRNGDACEANCTLPACGNSIVDIGEACDDGNTRNGDACEANCTLPVCGNGIVDAGEACDDGNTTNGDACDTNCTVPACGNNIVDPNEACDDGNTTNGDACEADCTLPVCGNGIVDIGEQCDDGNTTNGDACDANCTIPNCGNGIVDAGEQCDDGNTTNGDACEANCTLPRCGNGIVDIGETCDDGNAINSDGCNNSCRSTTITYVKASNTDTNDEFGVGVALSADGSTLAVSALTEGSTATGIDGDQTDNAAPEAGAVYVFVRAGTTWMQQAYIKASNTGAGDQFGQSIALSADGSTLAVGAIHESSAATGIDGNQADNSAFGAGAVYVFTRSGTTWSQQAYVKASNTNPSDQFGFSVALSADGSILAVGAIHESSAATGIDGNQADNSAMSAGAVYVFARSGTTWSQQAYVKASNTGASDKFGQGVALSSDGATLAVGALTESSAATGIDGDQTNNSAQRAGAAYVFTRSGTTWSQQAYIKASNTDAGDMFGQCVALSADGSTLAVGALFESSAASGINGNQADNSAVAAGAAYVYARTGGVWTQQAYVKPSNPGVADLFGGSIALSADGSILAVSAVLEDSAATGIGGNQADNAAVNSGALYVFKRDGTTWSQHAYLKASNTGADEEFGVGIALLPNGSLVTSAPFEDSAATGIGGDQTSTAAPKAGAAYIFE